MAGSRELTSVVAPPSPAVSNVKEKDVKRPPLVALICLMLVNIVAWCCNHGKKRRHRMDDGCCFVDMIHELCWPSQVEGIDSQLIPGCLFALQLWRNTTKHRKEGKNLRVFTVVLAAKNVPTSRSLVVVFTPQFFGGRRSHFDDVANGVLQPPPSVVSWLTMISFVGRCVFPM